VDIAQVAHFSCCHALGYAIDIVFFAGKRPELFRLLITPSGKLRSRDFGE
jgi:hypothetical protein